MNFKIIVTKPKEIICFDYDKTLSEAGIVWGETKYSRQTLELFRDLLVESSEKQRLMIILTGNSFGSVYRRGITKLIELLKESDQLEYIQNLRGYFSTNVTKTTFDHSGFPIFDAEFGSDIKVDPVWGERIASDTKMIMSGMGVNPLYKAYIDWLKWKNPEFIKNNGADIVQWPDIEVVDSDTEIKNKALLVINRYAPSENPADRKVIKVTLKGVPSDGAYINNYGSNVLMKSIYWLLEAAKLKKPNKTTFRSLLHYILERKYNGEFQVIEAGAGSIDFNSHGAAGGKMVCIDDIKDVFGLKYENFIHIGDEARLKNKEGHWGNDLDPAEKVVTYNTGPDDFSDLLPGYLQHNVVEANKKGKLSTVKATVNVLEAIKKRGSIDIRSDFN